MLGRTVNSIHEDEDAKTSARSTADQSEWVYANARSIERHYLEHNAAGLSGCFHSGRVNIACPARSTEVGAPSQSLLQQYNSLQRSTTCHALPVECQAAIAVPIHLVIRSKAKHRRVNQTDCDYCDYAMPSAARSVGPETRRRVGVLQVLVLNEVLQYYVGHTNR